jgi:hypothetical protein
MKFPTRLITSLVHAWLALILSAASLAAHAQANAIEAINASSQSGGKVVIRVTLKEAPANPPAGFTINNPPRIAFDFPNTGSSLARGTQEIGEGDLRSINVVQAGERTRRRAESRARALLRHSDRRQDAPHHAAGLRRRRGSRRASPPISPSRGQPTGATACATSISVAAPRAKAASWSICPTAPVGIDLKVQGKVHRRRLHQHGAAQEPGAAPGRDRFRHARCRR